MSSILVIGAVILLGGLFLGLILKMIKWVLILAVVAGVAGYLYFSDTFSGDQSQGGGDQKSMSIPDSGWMDTLEAGLIMVAAVIGLILFIKVLFSVNKKFGQENPPHWRLHSQQQDEDDHRYQQDQYYDDQGYWR